MADTEKSEVAKREEIIQAFWKENDEFAPTATDKIFSVPTGTLNGTHRFNLTQSPEEGGWESDPFGHFHGRRFTVNKPGLYTVGVQLIDTSKAGPEPTV